MRWCHLVSRSINMTTQLTQADWPSVTRPVLSTLHDLSPSTEYVKLSYLFPWLRLRQPPITLVCLPSSCFRRLPPVLRVNHTCSVPLCDTANIASLSVSLILLPPCLSLLPLLCIFLAISMAVELLGMCAADGK